MLVEAKALHDSVKQLFEELLPLLQLLELKTDSEQQTMGLQQADTAYACRETVDMLETLRKKIEKLATKTHIVCNYYMIGAGVKKLETINCTVAPKPRLWFKIPSKRAYDPPEFDRLHTWCGVPPNMYEKEIVRIHTPNFMDHMTELIGEGKETPVDPAKIRSVTLGLTIRKKKAI